VAEQVGGRGENAGGDVRRGNLAALGHSASNAFAHTFGWAIAFTVIAAVPAILLPGKLGS
jgi:hypothetical protein